MSETNQHGELYGFSMPDGNTYVGNWKENDPNRLEKVMVVRTIFQEMGISQNKISVDCTRPNTLHVLTSAYLGTSISSELPNSDNFNPDAALIRWYLQPHVPKFKK